jgi:protein-disulfide isomerase
MPTKTDSQPPATNNKRVHIRGIRKINFRWLAKINITYILFFLLIIASFLLGVLYTKVQYLEKGVTINTANNNNEADYIADAPQQPVGPVDVEEGTLPILGNKDAKATLVLFSDFQCPFCEQFYTDVLPQLKTDYIDTGKAKLSFRHYPLSQIHPNAQKAAEASECANEQDKFWEYHNLLFENQQEWSALEADAVQTKFTEYATTLGLDGGSFSECLSSDKMAEKVKADLDAGIKAGAQGTPATFVNGMLVSGAVPFSEFKAEIENALKKDN